MERGSETLEKIIRHHIPPGNNVITNKWGSYSWMNNPHSGYNRIIHIHGNRDFWFGEESTSHIKSVWGDIKRILIGIYTAVRPENIVFLIKECEIRKKVSCLSSSGKLFKLQEIFNHIKEPVKLDIYEKSDIEDFTKDDYEDYLEEVEESDDENNFMDIDL